MKRVLLFGVLWLAATAATGAVAWGAVRLAGEQAGEQAVRPMTARQVQALATSTSGAAPSNTTVTTAAAGLPASTTTSSTVGPSTSTPSASSTSTAAPVVAARRTRGGTVVVTLQDGRLSLVSATPAAGYSVEVEDAGPDKIAVTFEGPEDDEVRVQAAVSGDEVAFEVGAGDDED